MSIFLLLTALSLSKSPHVFNQVTPIAAIINPQVSGNQATNPQSLLEQGLTLYQKEQYSPALQIFQQAYEAFQAQGETLNQALVLNYISLTYQQLGQLTDAEKSSEQSLQLLQNKSDSKDYLSILAQALNTQGQLQLAKGETEKALSSWQKQQLLIIKLAMRQGKLGVRLIKPKHCKH